MHSHHHRPIDRPPLKKPDERANKHAGKHVEKHTDKHEQKVRRFIEVDRQEEIAQNIIDSGVDYLLAKLEARHGPDGVDQPYQAAAAVNADAVAEKIMKEGARELARAASHQSGGVIPADSLPAIAMSVVSHMHNTDADTSVEHKIAQRIRQKLHYAQERVDNHMFKELVPEHGKHRELHDKLRKLHETFVAGEHQSPHEKEPDRITEYFKVK